MSEVLGEKQKLPSTHVRFDEDEYCKIQKDSEVSGESIPTLLKQAYFKARVPMAFLPAEERKAWFQELHRWGVNLNQLVRRVNSGFSEGWYPELLEIKKRVEAIQAMVESAYGRRRVKV